MKNYLPLITILFAIFILSSCGQDTLTGSNALSSTTFSNSSINGKWNTTDIPLTLHASNSFTAGEATTLASMGDKWETAVNNVLNFFSFGAQVANKDFSNMDDYFDSELGIYLNTNWPSSVSYYALAITQYYGYRRNVGSSNEYIELVHADVILNNTYFTFSFNGGVGTYDVPSVVLHELGHFIGLGHSSVTPSVMAPTLSSNTQARSLYANDINTIKANYGLAALSAQSSLQAGSRLNYEVIESLENTTEKVEGELIKGQLELRYDGSCIHREESIGLMAHPATHWLAWKQKMHKIWSTLTWN